MLFNQDISNPRLGCLTSVTIMEDMFNNAYAFNGNAIAEVVNGNH